MNRDVINSILNEVESANAEYAVGKIKRPDYDSRMRDLNDRLNVYGLALANIAVTPPF